MKKFIFSWIGLVLVFSLSSDALAWKKKKNYYNNSKYSSQACNWTADSDGIIPVPFDIFNRTVELASGQIYALEGTVFFRSGLPYLDVDLDRQPWLGKTTRASNPSYPLLKSSLDWTDYKYKKVRVIVRAKGMIIKDYVGEPSYQIFLEPIVTN